MVFVSSIVSAQQDRVYGYSESTAKAYFDSNANSLNPIEGIWQTRDGEKYAIEKDVENGIRQEGKYRIVNLNHRYNWEKEGLIEGLVIDGSSDVHYSMKWNARRLSDGVVVETSYASVIREGFNLNILGPQTITWYKLYPKENNSSIGSSPSQFGSKWSGTGFFLTKNGYVITNQHVIDGAKSIKVTSVNGNHNMTYNAKVEVSDKQNDLAIIKITDSFSSITSIPYTFKFNTSNIGENCWVLGYPLTQTMGEDIKLTNGIISSRSGFEGNIAQYQISAPVQPGNSGGPVFDNSGNLIGVVQAKHGMAENASYAIKASYIRNLVDMLPTSITYPQTNQLNGKTLPQQVELASKCVCLIICE